MQIGRGIANTPAAIHAKTTEQVWDEDKRIWYHYSLVEEEKEVNVKEAAPSLAPKTVCDMALYNQLGVLPSATHGIFELI